MVSDGAPIAAAAGFVVVVVGGAVVAEEPLADPAAGADGAFTANCVPVTTVTCAPSVTLLGS